MSEGNRDRQLGIGRRITRRDFLNGVAVGIGALGSASLPGPAAGMHGLTAGADTAKNLSACFDRFERQRPRLFRCCARAARRDFLG